MTPKRPQLWEQRGDGVRPTGSSPDPSSPSQARARDELSQGCFDQAGFAAFLKISYRSFTRAKAAGLLPRPDLMLGSSPRWSPDTVSKWLKTRPSLPGRGRKGARR
jgi:hypothetical protein